jgi:hypothetical protein
MGVKLYVTYGYGTPLRNCFSVAEGEDLMAAYEQIREVCGTKYAFSYTEKDFEGQQERYGLTEVPLQPCSALPEQNQED